MNILIVSATFKESADLVKLLDLKPINKNFYQKKTEKNNISLLISGVGLSFTSYSLSKAVFKSRYDWVINTGIAGSFNKNLKIGDVVQVTDDCFADLGIRDKNQFIDIFEAGFIDKNEYPFNNARLKATDVNFPALKKIKKVKGISVNTVSGNKEEIIQLQQKYKADTESMEGAAVFYVCLNENIPVIQIRSISNYVEERDKTKWDIPLAIKNLNRFIFSFIHNIL
ncbi:MAG: futalosine hydrolase [Bacteroidales bacterium]|nr:futalosine hydrolase [Bacteroidales bacterium]